LDIVRKNLQSSFVYPIWFYPDTGSWPSFLENKTRSALGFAVDNNDDVPLYLYGIIKP